MHLSTFTFWQNAKEAQTIIHLVKKYYTGKNYCIITPYDGQRSHLQAELKGEGLRWDNVFNVDSFQGSPTTSYLSLSIYRFLTFGSQETRRTTF